QSGAEFDRPGGVPTHLVGSLGIILLIVPEAYAAPGAMAVIADRMGIDGRLQACRQRLRTRFGQDPVAGQAGPEGAGQGVLDGIGSLEAVLEPLRRVPLAVAQDISEMLHVGIEPQIGDSKIDPDDVALADDLVPLQHAFAALPHDPDRGLEPGAEAEAAHFLPEPPDEV